MGDQLGSANTLVKDTAVVSQQRFLPFGERRGWDDEAVAPWQNRGYTGHLHNNEVGLIYMNARHYVPSLGRFASADTIVPDPSNPQQFNRFSYVLNNPIRLSDPSGHVCYDHTAGPELFGMCVNEDGSTYSLWPTLEEQVQQGKNAYGIIFSADSGEAWTDAQKLEILRAAQDVELAFRSAGVAGYVPGSTWKRLFGTVIMHRSSKTEWTDEDGVKHPITYGAMVFGRKIEVYDEAVDGVSMSSFRLNMVHEFGHSFNGRTDDTTEMNPYNDLTAALSAEGELSDFRFDPRIGMDPYPLQQSTENLIRELYADYFLNWVYGSFNSAGAAQYNWMNSQIGRWSQRP